MKEYIEELNKKLLQSIDNTYPVGLANGLMGISIYFYHLSRIEENENYKTIAEQLLDETLEKLLLDSSLSVEKGLAGIALGVTHLIKSDFVAGDVNELLEDIDNIIFRHIAFMESNLFDQKKELLHLLFYLSVRLNDQTNEDSQYLFRELIIKVINIFATGLQDDFLDEPFSFSIYDYHLPLFTYISYCLLKQDFYNDRIYKILEEFELKILSRFPVLHINRLYLLCTVLPLVTYMQNPQWKEYANLLHKEISLPIIFEQEIKNKHIFVSNGLPMVYLLLHYLKENYSEYEIVHHPQDFYEKIISSDAWDSLLRKDYFFNIHSGLLNGFPGTQLVLLHIKNKNA